MLVSRWGNSLGVRLPRALVDSLGLKPGDKLEVVAATSRQRKDARREQAVESHARPRTALSRGLRFRPR